MLLWNGTHSRGDGALEEPSASWAGFGFLFIEFVELVLEL
jgi:hypothetical protein